MSSVLDLGSLVGEVRLDATLFETTYVRVVRQMAELGAKAGAAAVGTSNLDRSLADAGASAGAAAAGLDRADRALAGAGVSASQAAAATGTYKAATTDAALASSKLTQAQLRQAAAEERLTTLQLSGTASTGRLAAAQASLIAANDRVALSQKRVGETSLSSMGFFGRLSQSGRDLSGAMSSIPTPVTAAAGAIAKLGAVVGITGAAIAYEAVKAAASFQQATNVYVTAAGETVGNLATVRAGILNIARETGTSIENLTAGMYLLEKAGDRGASGLRVLMAAAQGAREENASLASVVNAMTSVMASYHLGTDKSVQVMNALKTGAGEAKTTMEEFAASLSTVIPIASANSIGIAQVLGALATLTQHGTTAAEATQELAATIRALAAPNRVAMTQMQQLGLSVTDVTKNIGQHGLTGTIDLLVGSITQHMGPAGLVLQDAFNQSKSAAQDANLMISHMPANVAALAKQYQAGSITLKDWRTALKALSPEQASLAQQFAVVQNRAAGFNSLLRSGDPAAQTFTSALRKMAGGAIGLNTILQLSGGNMAGFKQRTDAVSASLNDNRSSVEGWASTQKLFSVEADRAKESLRVMEIELGTKLLPTATRAMGWIATKGVADLTAFGHWFERNAATIGNFGADFVLVFRDMFDAVSFWARGFVDMMDHALGWVPHYGAELHKARLAVDAFADGTHDKLGQLAAGMRSLGESVSEGYAAGITAGEAAAINAAALMAQAVVRTVKKEHAIASPSKVFAALGKEIPAGTAVGIEAGTPKAVAAAKKMAAATKKAVIPPMETLGADLAKALGSGFGGYQGQLAKIFTGSTLSALDNVANQLQTAMGRYQTDVASRSQMKTSIAQGLLSSADISQLATSNTGGGSIRGNNATLITQLGRLNKDIARLRKLHLDPTYLQQIASAPPAQGIALAEDILSGREGSIGSLDRQAAQLRSLTNSIGGTVATATYATTIRHDEQVLDKVAHALVTFVNKKLDLSSSAERAMERAFERALRRAAPGISVKDLDRALGLSLTHAGG